MPVRSVSCDATKASAIEQHGSSRGSTRADGVELGRCPRRHLAAPELRTRVNKIWESYLRDSTGAPLRLRDDFAVNRDGSRLKKGIVREEGFSNELLL